MGVAACLVILKYIDFETSYDSFHVNSPTLYRVVRSITQNGETKLPNVVTSYGLGPALEADFPEIKQSIRTHSMYGGAVIMYTPATGQHLAFHMDKIQMVDPAFLRAFSFKAINGSAETALDKPSSVVITKAVAEKYFGNEDPLGKTLKVAGGWSDGEYTVTAVLENIPGNTHFNFDVLLPTHNLLQNGQYLQDDGWGWNNFITYVELNNENSIEKVRRRLAAFTKQIMDVRTSDSGFETTLQFQPIREIHTDTGIRIDTGGISRSSIYFFATIAVFILFIAWINYINLSTARALERAREVGIKKSVGAYRSQLITQFFFESVLINFVGIVLATGLAVGLLPVVANIIGKELTFDFSDHRLWFTLLGLFVFGSLASGVYPALALSSFRIVDVLKGQQKSGGFSLRQVLVVFQFAASLLLIAGTFVVYRQISFMQNHDKGLRMDQMLVVNGPSILTWEQSKQRMRIFKDELKKVPGVSDVATSASIPGGGHNWGADIRRIGTQPKDFKSGSVVWIDPDFIPVYDIKFISGKNFDANVKSDMESVIINEASLAAFGLGTAEQALSQQLLMGDDTCAILGVVKNYNWNSLKSDHMPFLFRADTISTAKISIHLKGENMSNTVAAIEKLYTQLIPDDPFRYDFLDDFFNTQYRTDQQFGEIFAIFAGLAVIISCLGLLGLASFTTTQKLKEIGVRKVLGASISSIIYLLTRRFMRLILIASVISFPLTWYAMDTWLSGFAFRVGIQWELFFIPLLILIVIALITVSVQVLKGAMTNPTRVLRSE